MFVTLILLGVLMTTFVPLLGWVNAQRRASSSRRIAVQETANLLERFTARDWKEITQTSANAVRISADSKAVLRDPTLKITVKDLATQPVARQITVELRWKNREGDFVSPARLTCLVYQTGESQ